MRTLAFVASITLLGLTTANGQKVNTEFDKDADFSKYTKYMWREHPLVAKHPEVRRFTVASQLVLSGVNSNLMDRGYIPVEQDPDLILTFFVAARGAQEITTAPAAGFSAGAYMWPTAWYAWSPVWFTAWETTVRDYAKGILLLDFVDAKTNHLVWRAMCSDDIQEMKNRDKNIDRAITKALKKFPPKK